jgi:hypothetical protein
LQKPDSDVGQVDRHPVAGDDDFDHTRFQRTVLRGSSGRQVSRQLIPASYAR